ncbi:hypothetical protein ERX27_02600 [Macrococcus brunensis]|uniref:Uncharacterized protein n=1 Tax=Macrococcus brunensis TaxID=198483 RepID=A0A4R6BFQ2_9STAP|nr:hypothetical protein [Macrococcus brunensis]TDL98684.1 hypothetical protein ERX27_02600 [Macrococcus brunensis]
MVKSKKIVVVDVATTLLFPIFNGTAKASTDLNEPEKVIPYNGTNYEPSSTNTYSQVGWTYLHKNPSSVTDTVSYNVSRTKSATASVSSSTEFGIMKTGVGIAAEMSLNTSTTVSYTVTYSIPPYTSYLLRVGSQKVKTNGYIVRYSNGLVSSKKYVSGDWSYRGFSDKIKQ